ncbi:MAG: hypothetical protein GC168_05940 [Candidatus Hydrogenedens sp.]|nr:hypothetical protein [Candidatus Hydrogenedens sp.]
MSDTAATPSLFRRILRWTFRIVLVLVVLIAGVVLFFLRDALYNRYIYLPRMAQAMEELKTTHRDVTLDDAWTEYRCTLHTHSKFSHDSEMEWEDILAAAKKSKVQALMMSDHCVNTQASFAWQWRGLHDGVLFVPGFEMNYGYLVWGLPEDLTLDCKWQANQLAVKIDENDGTLFYAHSEEDRLWDSPYYGGMEIYNIHTDFKDESLADMLPNMMLAANTYGAQAYRLLFDRQTEILKHWDELNQTRHITGFAASDAHQNIGLRIKYTFDGMLEIGDTSPKPGKKFALNPVTRLLARLAFGKLEPGTTLYRLDADPYERSLNFVNTHVLAKELTQDAILGALHEGRAFIAFNMIADAEGFVFFAEDGPTQATMGESIPFSPTMKLRADAPFPCRYTVVRDGEVVYQGDGPELRYEPTGPGQYRLEAEVMLMDEWTPWIYTNPILITPKVELAQR